MEVLLNWQSPWELWVLRLLDLQFPAAKLLQMLFVVGGLNRYS